MLFWKEFGSKEKKVKSKLKEEFFDLYWFMKQKVIPNYDCIFYQGEKISPQKLWDLIEKKIKKVNLSDLEYDLLPLIRDRIFVKQFFLILKV